MSEIGTKVIKMRDATPEERESVDEYIKSISKPTGVNFWDLEQEPIPDYKTFAEWVANEIFTEDWDLNKDAFAEIACRKLNKLGIVASEGNAWKLKESEVQE